MLGWALSCGVEDRIVADVSGSSARRSFRLRQLSGARDLGYVAVGDQESSMKQLMIVFVVAAGLTAPSLAAPCKDTKACL